MILFHMSTRHFFTENEDSSVAKQTHLFTTTKDGLSDDGDDGPCADSVTRIQTNQQTDESAPLTAEVGQGELQVGMFLCTNIRSS